MIQRSSESASFTLTGDVPDASPRLAVKLERDAVTWLREKLRGQDRRIGELTREWCRREEKWWKEDLEALMAAKNALRLMSYVGQDGRFWWELPPEAHPSVPPPRGTRLREP